MLGILLVAGRAVEEDTGIDLLEVDLDPDRFPVLLVESLGLLADGVDRGGVRDLELHAILLAGVAIERPAGLDRGALGLVEVELVGGVRALEVRDTADDVLRARLLGRRRGRSGWRSSRDRWPATKAWRTLRSDQERVRRVLLGPLAVDLLVRIGEVDQQALDIADRT